MDMNSTFARIAAGFAIRAFGVVAAIWIAVAVGGYVSDTFSKVNHGLDRIEQAR